MVVSDEDPSGVASLTETIDIWKEFKVKDMMDTMSGRPLCYAYTESKGDVVFKQASRCPDGKPPSFSWPFSHVAEMSRRDQGNMTGYGIDHVDLSSSNDAVSSNITAFDSATRTANASTSESTTFLFPSSFTPPPAFSTNISDPPARWQSSVSASKDKITNETIISYGNLANTTPVRVPHGYHVLAILRDRVIALSLSNQVESDQPYDSIVILTQQQQQQHRFSNTPEVLVLSNRLQISSPMYQSHKQCVKPYKNCLPEPRALPREMIEGQRMMDWDGYLRYVDKLKRAVDSCNIDLECQPVSLSS